MKNSLTTVLLVIALFSLGASYQNGRMITGPEVDAKYGQVHHYVTTTGTGDCTTWDNACKFSTAITKLSSTKMDMIHLGPGNHDLNAGAGGTTISDSYLHIMGMGGDYKAAGSYLVNSHATATNVLTLTGASTIISNVIFSNTAQTDKNVIFLSYNAARGAVVENCRFTQASTDGGGTGIYISGSSTSISIINSSFVNVIDYGVRTNGVRGVGLENITFYRGGTGVYVSNVADNAVTLKHVDFTSLTTGLNVAALSGVSCDFDELRFCDCTTAVTDASSYGTVEYTNTYNNDSTELVYPTTSGTTLDTGDGAWAWSAVQDIIPETTITSPFFIKGINIQDWNDAQSYKIELFKGATTPSESLGIYEVTLGDTVAKRHANVVVSMRKLVPANGTVGAKVMSSTAGVDTITVTLSYEKL